MQTDDCFTKVLLTILVVGCVIAIMPWWLILILLSPFLYIAAKMGWKIHQIKKMTQQDPFQQYQQQQRQQQYQQQQQQRSGNSNVHGTATNSGKKKVFDDNEGEYVDFEEVR